MSLLCHDLSFNTTIIWHVCFSFYVLLICTLCFHCAKLLCDNFYHHLFGVRIVSMISDQYICWFVNNCYCFDCTDTLSCHIYFIFVLFYNIIAIRTLIFEKSAAVICFDNLYYVIKTVCVH